MGTVYFLKYKGAFGDSTPQSLYNSFYAFEKTIHQQHFEWMDEIQNKIWERCISEDHLPPSNDALGLHWQRCCWVNDYWHQASMSTIKPLPINFYGWTTNNNTLSVVWDSPANLESIRNRVAFLTHGCSCKTGCQTLRCKCVKSTHPCGPGCFCGENCQNKDQPAAGNLHIIISIDTCIYTYTLCIVYIHVHHSYIVNTLTIMYLPIIIRSGGFIHVFTKANIPNQ